MGMRQILEGRIESWLDDTGSTVEYAEEVDGRWAVRMRQEARDATTVWFDVGERSLWYEAYVLPVAEASRDLLAQALLRNMKGWRAHFALDREDGLVLRGRLAEEHVTDLELDLALGEIYDTIEVSFRPLVRALTSDREKSG
ncbi:MAG TPA: YbjN domain-containing protein [Acidimicrobiia bacterium]|nr:YbjN domain-containing protein [Acidimicrobiia bacterium]